VDDASISFYLVLSNRAWSLRSVASELAFFFDMETDSVLRMVHIQ
jgi:hypothetical protein